jgi:hypothetical protein
LLVVQDTYAGSMGLKSFFQSFAYQLNQDGFVYKDPTNGSSTANDRPVRSWIADYEATIPGAQDNMLSGSAAGADGAGYQLDEATLSSVVDAAIALWTQALGAGDSRLEALAGLHVSIADLPGLALGQTIGNAVTLDINAAGHGWYVDASPASSSEFSLGVDHALYAGESSAAFNRMDLLTVVAHEIGHVLGFEHQDQRIYPWMSESLLTGERLATSVADHGSDFLAALDAAEARDVATELKLSQLENWLHRMSPGQADAAKSFSFEALFGDKAGAGAKSGIDWSGGFDKVWDRFSPFAKGAKGGDASDLISSLFDSDKDDATDEAGGFEKLGSSMRGNGKAADGGSNHQAARR